MDNVSYIKGIVVATLVFGFAGLTAQLGIGNMTAVAGGTRVTATAAATIISGTNNPPRAFAMSAGQVVAVQEPDDTYNAQIWESDLILIGWQQRARDKRLIFLLEHYN